MTFVLAFLLGGAFCALAQLVFMVAKMENPIPCLIAFFCLGGVLGVFGIIPMLEETCQAGMMALALDPGFGIQGGVFSALAGNPLPLVALLATITCMIVMGLITGTIASSHVAQDQK
ncbi:SpoVA/SpoVAEb family sporulation membrane protein [Collinsella provencensis]|uniref:SpoVA/SpoVAEb family sporulation membrane protein n=1 Tax=Collinsella provencensis TaxID=1937461 RepID=UPI000C81C940|nr:SpoVA/SpoVAEb family sporulation membrane protein [Collinsella provencensis]